MKRIGSVLLAIGIALSVAGCGAGQIPKAEWDATLINASQAEMLKDQWALVQKYQRPNSYDRAYWMKLIAVALRLDAGQITQEQFLTKEAEYRAIRDAQYAASRPTTVVVNQPYQPGPVFVPPNTGRCIGCL